MILIPDEIKNIIYSAEGYRNIRIQFDDDTPDITGDRLQGEDFKLESVLCDAEQLKFGKCISSYVEFTAAYIEDITGKRITIIYEIECNESIPGSCYQSDINKVIYPIPYGVFYVTSCEAEANKIRRNIIAYDKMNQFANKNIFDFYDSFTYPTTMYMFRTALCEYLGIEQVERKLANDDMIINKTLYDRDMSALYLLEAICEINGVFGHINNQEAFQYIPIDPDDGMLYPSETLYPSNNLYPGGRNGNTEAISIYRSLETEDYIAAAPDKVQIATEEGDIGAISGDGNNMYSITDNLFIFGKKSDELKSVADNFYSAICRAEYRPLKAYMVGNPALELGDYITFIRNDGSRVGTFILSRTLSGILALKDNIETKGAVQYKYDTTTLNSEVKRLKQKTNKVTNKVEQYRREMSEIEEDLNGKYNYAISYVDMTATSLEAKIAEGNLEWEIGDLVISLYGYGDPPTELSVSYGGGSLYLDNTTGKVYEVESVSAVASFSGPTIYEYTWKFYRQLEKKETEYWTAINANAHAIELEAYQRQTAIENEESARKESITELSSMITQTAESITSEVTARKNADEELQSQLTQTAKDISAKVSSTGGDSSSFSWSLDANGFYLYSNGELVATFDKNSSVFKGMVKANSGYFGTETVGFSLESDGTLSSKETTDIWYYGESAVPDTEGKIVAFYTTKPVISISPEGIEMYSKNGADVGDTTYTFISGGIIYSCRINRIHTPTEDAPWSFTGENEIIIKDGNIYIPNRTLKNGEVGNIYVQANASKQSDGTLKTGKYRRGMYSSFTVTDTDGTNHVLRIRNGIIMSGLAEYDDPFYDGESIPE